jgi:hypothetical protein
VRFWDARAKTCVGEVKVGGEAFTLAWKPDGSEIVVGRKVRTPPFPAKGGRRETEAEVLLFKGEYNDEANVSLLLLEALANKVL